MFFQFSEKTIDASPTQDAMGPVVAAARGVASPLGVVAPGLHLRHTAAARQRGERRHPKAEDSRGFGRRWTAWLGTRLCREIEGPSTPAPGSPPGKVPNQSFGGKYAAALPAERPLRGDFRQTQPSWALETNDLNGPWPDQRHTKTDQPDSYRMWTAMPVGGGRLWLASIHSTLWWPSSGRLDWGQIAFHPHMRIARVEFHIRVRATRSLRQKPEGTKTARGNSKVQVSPRSKSCGSCLYHPSTSTAIQWAVRNRQDRMAWLKLREF